MSLELRHITTLSHEFQLSDISLRLNAGQITAIIGANGAGKSTLLRCISQELSYQGQIELNGLSLHDMSNQRRARELAILSQKSQLTFGFSVHEVVSLGRIPHNSGLTQDKKIINQAMQLCDVEHLQQRLFPTLSGGEQQRVHLARVLTQIWPTETTPAAKFLLLDEPSNALDIKHQQQLHHWLKDISQMNIGILYIGHDLNQISMIADHIIWLDKGNIAVQGDAHTVFTKANMASYFDLEVEIIDHPSYRKPMMLPAGGAHVTLPS